VNLKADDTFWMRPVDFLVDQSGDLLAVDPGLYHGAFRYDSVVVPFAVLVVFVRLEIYLGRAPSSGGFSIDVAGFGTF
jgi:hypothetical protein